MGLVNINPVEYGLTDETAKNIQQQFQPMLEKMVELETEYNEVVSLPIEDPNSAKKAKELRLKYVKVRTGTADIHKQQKAFYLNGGRFVDGWKNAQLFASQNKEETLEKIEKYQEIKERERIEKLELQRIELIREFVEDATGLSLGTMSDDVFDAYLTAKKKSHFDRIEAEKKAEQDHIEKEKAEAAERERMRLENEKLKAEAQAKEKELQKQKEDAEKAMAAERAKAELERKKIEAEAQAKLDSEIAQRKKIEAEQMAAEKERQRIEAEKLAQIEKDQKEQAKLEKAPIKKQMKVWVTGFSLPEISLTNDKKDEIVAKFEAFKKWCESQIDLM